METNGTPHKHPKSSPVPDLSQLNNLSLVRLPGSERPAAPGFAEAHAVPLDPQAKVPATLVLRRRSEPEAQDFTAPWSRTELTERFGASEQDIQLVTSTLSRLGLEIAGTDAGSRRIQVSGPAAIVARVFGTDLTEFNPPDQQRSVQRHRSGSLSIPAELNGVVTAVLGLDDRPQSRALFRLARAAAHTTSYTPLELGSVYKFPAGQDGAGQSIGIIELGGGFSQTELDQYFSSLGIKSPKVTAVGVDGAANQPGQDPNGADGEVLLDIEVAGALAPGAELVVYFAPNTDAGFVDAVSTAAGASPTPAALSISWGQSEDAWTAQARNAFDQAVADAVLLGVTVTAAAGDDGSTDRAADGKAHVDFPASSPHVLACGGTRLEADAASGAVTSETVWNNGAGSGATGGGVSSSFPVPAWQRKVGVPAPAGHAGRGVPDVAAVADPQTGYKVLVDGKQMVIGGTSAVAPLWAALVARLAQATGKPLGLLQPVLYASARQGSVAPGFRDVVSGNNGAFAAAPGWDACTGLGVPDGTRLLEVVQGKAATATP